TLNGVLKIDLKALKLDTTQVQIQIDYIKNADKLLNISDNKIEINPVKRNLIICFKPNENPSLLNNIYYDYTLINSDNDTISFQYRSKNNLFNVDYIPPDNYIFEIKAYKNGILQDKSSFEILVPYTFGENPFIWLLGLILVLIVLSIFLFYRNEHFKKLAIKERKLTETEKEKEELKVQTIVNAFNPHFINNSLHWIQSRYNDDPDTVKMISRLSYNIYDIFKKTRSGQAIHSLEEELKILENYIEIQKLRFGDSFSFILPEKEIIEKYKDLKLIVMQLQIHVENAIEHGIRNRMESSFVKLDIIEKEEYIIISVTDDGVGRKKAKEIGSRGTQSGIKMLKQLYTIFNNNPNNQLKISSYYQDEIFEKNGIRFGTKLIIQIPKNFIFEIM
ncbi:MAG TPA: hypothetical protein ENK91_05915, partial [Bacteroidetes bacterium]|nr:hypothetical protein [Bacteroidota bacterium]